MITRIFDWLEKRENPFPSPMPDQPPSEFWPFVVHYSKPFLPLLIAASLLAALIALIEVSLFAFLGNLVDWLATTERQTFWDNHGAFVVFMGAVVLLILPLLKFFYEAVVHQGLLSNFAMRTRWQTHRYVLRQSMDFFQNDFAGRVSAKVMQTAVALREAVMKVTEVLVYVGVYFTGGVILFAATDLRLAAPMVVWFIGYAIAMRYFIPKLGKIAEKQADARSTMTGRIVDSYTNIATVKMFAHADREDQYARNSMEIFLGTAYPMMRLATLLTVAINSLNAFLLASVAGLSVYLWSIDAVTTGAIALSVGLVLRMQGMSHWIMWEVASLFENIGVVKDGIESIAQERKVKDRPNAAALKISAGEIKYNNICFNYGKHRDDGVSGVIDNLSLHIKPGEKVGLVGPSGAGKSTLVNVLLRFYDLEDGQILIDNQDVANVTQASLRESVGMVTQDTSLLHRSVRDNVVYGRPGASDAQMIEAAKRAAAHDFILGLEDLKGRTGFDAHVGERGVKLSGGQRQRIAISRVLLKNAPILVLDEATSALDSEVEAAIQEQLVNLMEGKTVIAIAHRLSTIAAMDRLIVMDQGRIVQDGTHDQLLKQDGLYANLWTRQSGGFLPQTGVAA